MEPIYIDDYVNADWIKRVSRSVTAAANEDHSHSAMVAWYPSVEEANQLRLPGGETSDHLHSTLVYLGPSEAVHDSVPDIVAAIANRFSPFVAHVSGFAVFSVEDGKCLVALLDAPELEQIQQRLHDEIVPVMEIPDNHGFTAHVTLKYLAPDEEVDPAWFDHPTSDVKINAITCDFGTERTDYPLATEVVLGEDDGHPFRGNQHTGGIGGDGGIDIEKFIADRPRLPGEDIFVYQGRIVTGLPKEEQSELIFKTRERYEPVDYIREGANRWCEENGLPPLRDSIIETPCDIEEAEEAARYFERTPDQSDDPRVIAAYADFRAQSEEQWDFMTKPESEGGLGIRVDFTRETDPYDSAEHQATDLRENHHITLQSGLGGAHDATMTEPEYDRFRAVHDVFGHAGVGGGFDRHGEYEAWLAHSSMYTGAGRDAMSTEYHGVNSALWSGDPGTPGTGKSLLLPEDLSDPPWEQSVTASAAKTDQIIDALGLDAEWATRFDKAPWHPQGKKTAEFGEDDGHPFRGNQYTGGVGMDGVDKQAMREAIDKKNAERLAPRPPAKVEIDGAILRIWETYPGSEAIRMASENILGLPHPAEQAWDYNDGQVGEIIDEIGVSTIDPSEAAHDMLKALASDKDDVLPSGEAGVTRVEQWRGISLDGLSDEAYNKIAYLVPGESFDIGLSSVGNSSETAHAFGNDVTIKFEPGMRVLMGNDPSFEHITAGRFKVTDVQTVENPDAEDGERIYTVRQTAVFDPDSPLTDEQPGSNMVSIARRDPIPVTASADVKVLPASEADIDPDISSLFAKPKPVTAAIALDFGEGPDHPFRGNQHTGGIGGEKGEWESKSGDPRLAPLETRDGKNKGKALPIEMITMKELPKDTRDKVMEKVRDRVASTQKINASFDHFMERAWNNPEVREAGMTWYQRTHDLAAGIAKDHDLELQNVAAAFAAMSPGKQWSEEAGIIRGMADMDKGVVNLSDEKLDLVNQKMDGYELSHIDNGDKYEDIGSRQAVITMQSQFMEEDRGSWGVGYGYGNFAKGLDLMRNANVDDTLAGPKVRSFTNNIVDPNDPRDVTIDVHMVQGSARDPAVVNDSGVMSSPAYKGASIGIYPYIADVVRRVADDYGVLPQQAQALIWLGYKDEFSSTTGIQE